MHKPVSYIDRTRQLYDSLGYTPYNWFHAQSDPDFCPPRKKLSDSRLGLVSTAGTYIAGQMAYHYKDDTSTRRIPNNTPADKLRFSHVTENYLVDARQDPQCVVPGIALAQLQKEGFVGSLADNFYSCMGGIYSQRRVEEELIPTLASSLKDEEIDLLLLVPL